MSGTLDSPASPLATLDQVESTTSVAPTSTATSLPDNSFLQPGVTLAPTPCHEIIIQLSTAVLVKYDTFYPNIPLESFRPVYRALGDGSLISPPLDEELRSANLSLLVIGALAAVFLRNIYASADYIRRGKVKKKKLFYLLLASQLLAPVSLTPIIVSYFADNLNCTAVVHISYLSAMISLGILITGILGIKAYKCLENPRILLVLLGVLQLAATTFVILDVIRTRGARRLTGSCVQVSSLKFTRYFVSTQFFQSLLICLCFVYACIKSRGSPASRGRMSVRMSMDDLPIQMPPDPDDTNPQSRGWWDYVPEVQSEKQEQGKEKDDTMSGKNVIGSALKSVPSQMHRLRSSLDDRRSRDEPRRSQAADDSLDIGEGSRARPRPQHSPSTSVSSGSRLSRLVPRNLLRQVVKDELLYTTFITSTCVVVAILAFIGLNFKTSLSVTGWIILNWAIISLLTVHSFGRVIHRHEREEWIQQAASQSIRVGTAYPANSHRRTQTRSSSSTGPRRSKSTLKHYRGDPNDPYADIRPLEQDRTSWQFGRISPSDPSPHRSPLVLSVKSVSPDDRAAQEFEFERAHLPRNVSWQSTLNVPSRPINKF